MPLGGVSKQAGQDVAQQDQGHLLHVQAEDGVEKLYCPQCVLLASLLQQLLGRVGKQRLRFSYSAISTAKGAINPNLKVLL